MAIDPPLFNEPFCADIPADVAAFMAISQRSLSTAAFANLTPAAAWKVTVVDGASHAVFISQPATVAGVIREALAA